MIYDNLVKLEALIFMELGYLKILTIEAIFFYLDLKNWIDFEI